MLRETDIIAPINNKLSCLYFNKQHRVYSKCMDRHRSKEEFGLHRHRLSSSEKHLDTFVPQREKTYFLICAPAQSDQSPRCPHEETLHHWLSNIHVRPVKILISLRECAG